MDPSRLKTIPLFAELSEHERGQIAQWADEVDIREGEHLVHQGAFAHEFFVILEGTAEVTKDGEHVTDLGPGDFFGEIALLEEERRTASVTATSAMKVVVMFGRDFRQMDHQMPHVAQKVQRTLEERLKR
jgi:CRP/FNR family cyclic AMP-dependent transcriptional regulator